jgi:hypothetical protein
MTAQRIELVVAKHFNFRQNIIVPNVSWGMGLKYEADVVVLRPSGYAVEIEIKTTGSDIRADLKKRHNHNSQLFRELWFAVPDALAQHPSIPAKAGILVVRSDRGLYYVETLRRGKLNKFAVHWTPAQRDTLLRLAHMRIWTLKTHILDAQYRSVSA